MKKMLIIIIAAIVVLGAAAVLYFFVFSGDSDKPLPTFEYSPGDYFVTNVKDSAKLLKISVVLVVNDESFIENTLKVKNAQVRDIIIFNLRNLSQTDIERIGIEDELRETLLNNLNVVFEGEKFVNIYFNDFVMQ